MFRKCLKIILKFIFDKGSNQDELVRAIGLQKDILASYVHELIGLTEQRETGRGGLCLSRDEFCVVFEKLG